MLVVLVVKVNEPLMLGYLGERGAGGTLGSFERSVCMLCMLLMMLLKLMLMMMLCMAHAHLLFALGTLHARLVCQVMLW